MALLRKHMKCTVKFQRSPHGTAAVLMHRGASLNYMSYPRGHKVTLKEARRAKRSLLAQCDELAADHQRHVRRAKRKGDYMGALPSWWPFKKKPAKRHPMTRTVYVMKTKSGSYIPVDRPPSHAMAGARRRRKRRR